MKLICPDCGKQYESGKFCLECGAKLQEIVPELVCPSCGYKSKTGKFCPECGTKLVEQSAVSTTEVNKVADERKFNEKDERFAKYYDKKGFPRRIPQEERAIAIEELTNFAEQNVSEAKMLLGLILIKDSSDYDSKVKGANLMIEAENAGDKFAYYLLGIAFYEGWGDLVEQNHNEAEKRMLECFQEFKDEETAGMLAELYALSDEKRDYKKAFEYATIAAEDEGKEGYCVLGSLYLNGWGVKKDIDTALENYKMAAALGDETAMNQIGFIFFGGDDCEADPEQAFYWCNEAAQKGSDVGMNNLAYCYQNGIGVKQDNETAAEWYKKAAEKGYVDAMYSLGTYYEFVLIDSDKSRMWYQKAADCGHIGAQKKLSTINTNHESKETKNVVKTQVVNTSSPKELHISEGTRTLTKLEARSKSQVETIFLPDSLVTIKESLLSDLSNLCKIVIPNGKLDKFGKMLPYNWWRMYYENGNKACPEIEIPNGDKYIYPYGMPSLENGADANGHVLIPPTCTRIEKKAFRYNDKVVSVQMPDSVVSIGENAFATCSKMTSIRLSANLTEIPKSMLEYCKSLTEILIPHGVTSIGAGAFAQCKSLIRVSLPSTIVSIDRGGTFGSNPFQYSYSLEQIIVPHGTIKHFQSLLKGFGDNSAKLLVEEKPQRRAVQNSSSKATRSNATDKLPMDQIQQAANASYPKASLKNLAIAALKIAEVIQERIPDAEVSYMVHPSEFDSNIHPDALPIHFLFKRNGMPKVAVVAVTSNGYNTPLVLETKMACEDNGIEYIRVYADGTYSDWMQKGCDHETVEFCKTWLVKKINDAL